MAKSDKMVDMEMDDEASMDAIMPYPMAKKPRYPYGLQICLTEAELKKLKLDVPRIGDVIDLRAFAEVTCTSNEHGVRVELQIQKLAVENEEDENDTEAEEAAEGEPPRARRASLRKPIGD